MATADQAGGALPGATRTRDVTPGPGLAVRPAGPDPPPLRLDAIVDPHADARALVAAALERLHGLPEAARAPGDARSQRPSEPSLRGRMPAGRPRPGGETRRLWDPASRRRGR